MFSFVSLCYCLFAKTKPHFRRQQKLLKALQAIESDSAHFSGMVVSSKEQDLDPEVSLGFRESRGVHRPPKAEVEGRAHSFLVRRIPLLVASLVSLSLPLPPPQRSLS